MVRFIITILLHGTRLTPEFSINIKAFFVFQKNIGWNFTRPVLLMKPLHVNFHGIRLRKYFSTNFTTVWFLLKYISLKKCNLTFINFKIPLYEISDELFFEFQF